MHHHTYKNRSPTKTPVQSAGLVAQNGNIRENATHAPGTEIHAPGTETRAPGTETREDERGVEKNVIIRVYVYNNNVIPISRSLSLQGYIWASERRRPRLPYLRYRDSGCRGNHRRGVCVVAHFRCHILEISRRTVPYRDHHPPRVLCSHNGG